jgi:hypothetical protein
MKTQSYKRGTYNKPARKTKKIYVSLTAEENQKIIELSEKLQINYSSILRESFIKYYVEFIN